MCFHPRAREFFSSGKKHERERICLIMYENEISPTDPAELFHCYGPPIFSYLRLHASSREEAEDLTHDVFAAALGNPQLLTWSGPRQLGWLKRVAANKLTDSYRRANRRPAITLDQIVETLLDEHEPELVAQRSGIIYSYTSIFNNSHPCSSSFCACAMHMDYIPPRSRNCSTRVKQLCARCSHALLACSEPCTISHLPTLAKEKAHELQYTP